MEKNDLPFSRQLDKYNQVSKKLNTKREAFSLNANNIQSRNNDIFTKDENLENRFNLNNRDKYDYSSNNSYTQPTQKNKPISQYDIYASNSRNQADFNSDSFKNPIKTNFSTKNHTYNKNPGTFFNYEKNPESSFSNEYSQPNKYNKENYSFNDRAKSTNLPARSNHNEFLQENRTRNMGYETNPILESQNSSNQNDTKIIDRNASKNKISYDFMTGNDYEKKDKASFNTGKSNQSVGFMGILEKMKRLGDPNDKSEMQLNNNFQDEPTENDLDKFKRDLENARRMNMPKEEAENLLEIANSIVPSKIYEKFMRKNMHNKERIDNFKKAINKRVELHFDQNRKSKLSKILGIKI